MREWLDKQELLDRAAQALRDAANTAPRASNEHIEAAKIVAVMVAIDQYFNEKQSQAVGPAESPASVEGVPALEAPPAPPEPEPTFTPLAENEYVTN